VALPGLILTGASGFVGRHLLEVLAERYRIFGIARRSQARCGAPEHPNVSWFQVDIGEREALTTVFDQIRLAGGAQTLVHLAAHYDFTGDEHPEYERTNVVGLRNTLDLARACGVTNVVFSSSVAACKLPPLGSSLNEESPPDGVHVYARTKRIGEEMLREYEGSLRPVIVRFAALFSDWCEYPPLYMFLETWLTKAWNRRILGGNGITAIPYLHVRDVVSFLETVLDRLDDLAPREVLIASPDGATSHNELFRAATENMLGAARRPIHMPRLLCTPGMWTLDLLGRLWGQRPFERPWMARYIDTVMAIDASRTRARLGWAPRPRLEILRRLPFLVQNLKTDPLEWHRLNRAAMKEVHLPTNLRIHRLLERHEEEIIAAYTRTLLGPEGPVRYESYQKVSADDHEWNHRLVLGHLKNAVRTRDKGILLSYVRDLAARRYEQGFKGEDLCNALDALNRTCIQVLSRQPGGRELGDAIVDLVSMPLLFSMDEVQEVFDIRRERDERARRRLPPASGVSPGPPAHQPDHDPHEAVARG